MKIAIIGSGAMGSLFGAYLSKKNDVYMIDISQDAVNKINNFGICIEEQDHSKEYYHINAFLSGECKIICDLVILFVKSTQNIAALQKNLAIIGSNTILMSLQNGSGNDKDMARFVDKKQIVVGNTLNNCVTLENGNVYHSGCGLTIIGSLVNSDNVKVCANILKESSFETKIDNDINKVIWHKLFTNATLNPITALFNTKIKVCRENKDMWTLVENVLKEAILVANHDGCNFDYNEILKEIYDTTIRVGSGYTSMAQDLMNKRYTEIDKINGAISNLAYQYGIETPYNDFLVTAIHAKEKMF